MHHGLVTLGQCHGSNIWMCGRWRQIETPSRRSRNRPWLLAYSSGLVVSSTDGFVDGFANLLAYAVRHLLSLTPQFRTILSESTEPDAGKLCRLPLLTLHRAAGSVCVCAGGCMCMYAYVSVCVCARVRVCGGGRQGFSKARAPS